jgi:hypothetical protein
MNLIELLSFLFALFLSVYLGMNFYAHIGRWGAIPATLLGFGSVIDFWKVVHLLLDYRDRNRRNESQSIPKDGHT